MTSTQCRFCKTPLKHSFTDLGMSPLSNAYLKQENLLEMEPFYPLNVFVCESCHLVQLPEFQSPSDIFSDYAYFSSYSDTWLEHCERYCNTMTKRFSLNTNSQVIEIASNDGYLLQYFQKKGVPVLGIEPAENVAKVAEEAGIPTIVKFFGVETAHHLTGKGIGADLLVGNNVLAHVPDLNDFVEGLKIILNANGTITMEFPHLMRLMEQNQFDTIYHEHFSYFSFVTVDKVFSAHDLTIFDVEELPTHGGSLRIYARHASELSRPIEKSVLSLKENELAAGFGELAHYLSFNERVMRIKRDLLTFMISAKEDEKSIAGYGAPAKGNTLLNYCGIGLDFLDYTVDRNPHKQGCFLPGTHIPVYRPDIIRERRPDYLLVLPWNLKNEIMEQMAHIKQWGGKFVVPIPNVQVYE